MDAIVFADELDELRAMANRALAHMSATQWRNPTLVVWAYEPLIYDQMTEWFGQP